MALKSKNKKVEEVTKQRQQLINRAFVDELVEQAVVAYFLEFYRLVLEAPAGKPIYQRSVLAALTRAKDLTEQALSLDPSHSLAQDIMTNILLDEGDYLVETISYVTAIEKFRTALQFQPNNASVHSRFARALSKVGDLEGALAEQRTAITLAPRDARYRIGLGHLLLKKGEGDSAITEFRRAIQLNPAGGLAHTALGLALLGKGLKVEGQREADEGMRLMEENLRKCEEEDRSGKISICSADTGPVPGTSIPRSLGPIR